MEVRVPLCSSGLMLSSNIMLPRRRRANESFMIGPVNDRPSAKSSWTWLIWNPAPQAVLQGFLLRFCRCDER